MTNLIMGEPDESPKKFIYLVRHGETSMNAEKLMRGWDNPPLNPDGLQDAQDCAKGMKGIQIDETFCSDLKRAVQTMQTIVKDGVETDMLRTIDVGAWTGRPLDEVEPKLAALQNKWKSDPRAMAPGGESWEEFQSRQLTAWHRILNAKGRNILVVGHLRTSVWAMGYALVGMKPLVGNDLNLLGRITQLPGCITTMSYSRPEGLKILAVNSTVGVTGDQ